MQNTLVRGNLGLQGHVLLCASHVPAEFVPRVPQAVQDVGAQDAAAGVGAAPDPGAAGEQEAAGPWGCLSAPRQGQPLRRAARAARSRSSVCPQHGPDAALPGCHTNAGANAC